MTQQKQIKFDPFENLILDEYEQEIEDAINAGEYETFQITENDKKFFADMATKHIKLRESKRINIRINNLDIAKVKAKAKINNIPYQTLLSTLIHKYAQGELKITL